MIAAAIAACAIIPRPQRENMTKFIAQLREIFLMQMSLDIKHAEARNTSQSLELGWCP